MARPSNRLDDAVAVVLRAARIRRFNEAIAEFGVRGNPFTLKAVAARIGIHLSTLAGWEAMRRRPSLGYCESWASAVGARLTVTIDGQGVGD